jgi:8-oxo-dGTP diphosphatase
VSDGNPTIHVACGVLVNAAGEVLLAQRPEGKIAAGYWEFPGGKIEPGEAALDALRRELHEELGIGVQAAEPLIRFRHAYTNRTVVLDTWRVTAFAGEPQSREQQALRWLPVTRWGELAPLLPTVAPIAAALTHPAHYVFTPPDTDADWLLARLPGLPTGAWLRLRCPALDDAGYAALARVLVAAAQAHGHKVLLDRAPGLVDALGADGWHATTTALAALDARPAVPLAVASVHTARELARAAALHFDAAVLGPVQATATHPGASALGWTGFAALRGESVLSVYALGGLAPGDLAAARAANAQGLAGISAYWR